MCRVERTDKRVYREICTVDHSKLDKFYIFPNNVSNYGLWGWKDDSDAKIFKEKKNSKIK